MSDQNPQDDPTRVYAQQPQPAYQGRHSTMSA